MAASPQMSDKIESESVIATNTYFIWALCAKTISNFHFCLEQSVK